MLQNFVVPDLYPAAPELFLALMICVILLADLFLGQAQAFLTEFEALLGVLGLLLLLL